jgi:uncharacterized protein (DUF885 family)
MSTFRRSLSAATAVAALLLVAPDVSAAPAQTNSPPSTSSSPSDADNPVLAGVIADYSANVRAADPVTASMAGDRAALSRLPDLSRETELARLVELKALQARAQAIDAGQLTERDRLNLSFLSYLLNEGVERITLDEGRLAFNSIVGPSQKLGYIAQGVRVSTRPDAEAWIARLEAAGAYYDQTEANARRGLATGLAQPRPVAETLLVQLRADTALTPETDPLLKPLANLSTSIPLAEREALRRRAEAVVARVIAPRRVAWVHFLEDEYLPAAPVEPGIEQQPDGRAYYAFAVRQHTTTNLTPDQIHALGLEEVARIRQRMDTEIRASGWTGDFAGFLSFLRTDPQFYATSREQLLEKASEIAKRADGALPVLFGVLPRLTYAVRPVPVEIEEGYITGNYSPGSLANGVAAAFIVNTSHLDRRPLFDLPALTLHEAVPGHHLHLSLQQENKSLPVFRQRMDNMAFIEGWGLYAEYLGEEMGIYRTPYERFGRLSQEMWRACRLVADTGIHHLGWSLDQARECFTQNTALPDQTIDTELRRYVSWPGQALSYKIGEIRFRQLRGQAETALGERFDVRAFHDAILTEGALPLDLLDQRIQAWISAQTP